MSKTERHSRRLIETPAAPKRMARASEPPSFKPSWKGAQRHLLTQVLPVAGFSSPTTLIVLPHTLTGTCTGT